MSTQTCPSCNAPLTAGTRICPRCGGPAPEPPATSGRRTRVAGLAALVAGVLLVVALVAGILISRESPAPAPDPTPAPVPAEGATAALEHTDCVAYDPEGLEVEEAQDGWLLRAGEEMALTGHQTREDAERMMAVARRHTFQCFIGRGSEREDRHAYVLEYWLGNSGLISVLEDEDCIAYERDDLRIVDAGDDGWGLHAGEVQLHLLDNEADAERAMALARIYTRFCVIGGNTDTPHEYWG